MGYMDLMTQAENITMIRDLVDIQLRRDRPVLDNVFDIEDGFHKTRWMDKCIERLKKEPTSAKMLEERYMGPELIIDDLLKLPKDSLGYTYAKVMSVYGFNPHFYRDRASVEDESDYVVMRTRKTHDFYHILSGFDMQLGEAGTISLNVSQYSYPGFMLIDLVGLGVACFGLHNKPRDEFEAARLDKSGEMLFDLLVEGIQMGRKAKPLFPVKFEKILNKPLIQVRQELNIVPKKEGIGSWYQDPKLKDLGLS